MLTDFNLQRCLTRSVSIAASPGDVFEFVSDPANIPLWAPAFASAIRPDGERWLVTSAAGEFPIVVAAQDHAGTVDILSAADRTRGAFARILPNGHGSEMLFTLFFAPNASEAEVAAQMATVGDELAQVRRLVEQQVAA